MTAIPAYRENPQGYMDSLNQLYTETFNRDAKFLKNDTFISYAIKIAQEDGLSCHYGSRVRLLPRARDLLTKKAAFDEQIANGTFAPRVLAQFIDAHTTFTLAFAQEVCIIEKDSPYMYKKESYPKTVEFMLEVYRKAHRTLGEETQAEWNSQIEVSDFAIFERVTDLCILELLINPPSVLPEIFQSNESEISNLRAIYNHLSDEKKRVLRAKLMGESKEMDQETTRVFRDLCGIRSILQQNSKVWSTLMHTFVLSL